MRLRRIKEHVRDQNWTAIGIDFVIVVFGVFVGLEVSNWNEDRATAARSEAFTARLVEDVRYEAWAVEWLIAYYTEVRRNAELAAAALSGDTTLTDEALLIAAYRATQYKENERARATYDELVSTGEIGLIADDALRAAAIGVFSTPYFGQIAEEGLRSEYRRAFRRLVPADVQHALLRSCGDRWPDPGDYPALAAGLLDYPCTLDLPMDRVATTASTLRSDPSVLPALRQRFGDLETILTDLTKGFPTLLANLRHVAREDR